ncbi:MAG: hypothetical protein HY904_06295 [Deltaproteobacteria bacterium]|nr:hypothetical protein [Deltaproteobacteria bacterium]
MSALLLGPPLFLIFVVSAMAASACVSLFRRWSARQSALLAFLATAGPLLAALLTFAAFLGPLFEGHCHCAEHGLHHPHLCPLHPLHAAGLVAPSAYLLAAWALFVAPEVMVLAHSVLRAARWRRAVLRLPAQVIRGCQVRLSPCGGLGAVTVGLLRPVIVVDPRAWEALEPAEREAVVLHEAAHARRRDGSVLFILRLWSALVPVPSLRRTVDAWREAAEHACDRAAAATLGSPCTVAAALVAVEGSRHGCRGAPPLAVLPVAGGAGLEDRVQSLLAVEHGTTRAAVPALAPVVAVALAAAAIALTVPTHHLVETTLGFLLSSH